MPTINILNEINKRSKENCKTQNFTRKFDDLYSLLYRKEIVIQALGHIQSNKGSLTKGVSNETIDAISLKTISKITSQLKDRTFTFKAFRRISVPKPGKTKKRPLGIPIFTDRLIQEVIRIILDAIYEPIFENYNLNFGFRSKKSCHHAMLRIKILSSAFEFALEGDIVGAYHNINHDKLMSILSKTISDFRFLKIIKQSLKCGLLEFGK